MSLPRRFTDELGDAAEIQDDIVRNLKEAASTVESFLQDGEQRRAELQQELLLNAKKINKTRQRLNDIMSRIRRIEQALVRRGLMESLPLDDEDD